MLNQAIIFRACNVLSDHGKPTAQRNIPTGITNKPVTHNMKGKQNL